MYSIKASNLIINKITNILVIASQPTTAAEPGQRSVATRALAPGARPPSDPRRRSVHDWPVFRCPPWAPSKLADRAFGWALREALKANHIFEAARGTVPAIFGSRHTVSDRVESLRNRALSFLRCVD